MVEKVQKYQVIDNLIGGVKTFASIAELSDFIGSSGDWIRYEDELNAVGNHCDALTGLSWDKMIKKMDKELKMEYIVELWNDNAPRMNPEDGGKPFNELSIVTFQSYIVSITMPQTAYVRVLATSDDDAVSIVSDMVQEDDDLLADNLFWHEPDFDNWTEDAIIYPEGVEEDGDAEFNSERKVTTIYAGGN